MSDDGATGVHEQGSGRDVGPGPQRPELVAAADGTPAQWRGTLGAVVAEGPRAWSER